MAQKQICKINSVIVSPFKIVDSVTLPTGVTVPCIEGKASRSEVISQKGYRYRKGFWPQVLADADLQAMIENRQMLGMIEHPEDDNEFLCTPYKKAAVICLRAWIKNDEPFITLGLLNNEEGNAIKALIEVGHKPGVSTRAFGTYAEDGVSKYVEPDGYKVRAWDVVTRPNFEDIRMDKVGDSLGSLPDFRALMQMTELRDSVDGNYNPAKLKSEIEQVVQHLQKIQTLL